MAVDNCDSMKLMTSRKITMTVYASYTVLIRRNFFYVKPKSHQKKFAVEIVRTFTPLFVSLTKLYTKPTA